MRRGPASLTPLGARKLARAPAPCRRAWRAQQTTHGAIQFTVYEELKHAAARWGATSSQQPDRRVGSLETSGAAALSKLTASVVTYPSQVVRCAAASGLLVRPGSARRTQPGPLQGARVRGGRLSLCAAHVRRRSRLQQRFDLGRTRAYRSTWEVVRLTWQGEGLRGFYKGLGPALVRVMPQSAITLVAYENVLQLLKAQQQQQEERQGART